MAESRTYRRVPQDQREVDYIVGLIDKDVKDRAGDLATSDTDQLRELLNTQKRWREMRAELANPPTQPAGIITEPPDKEVKAEPRKTARTTTNTPAAS